MIRDAPSASGVEMPPIYLMPLQQQKKKENTHNKKNPISKTKQENEENNMVDDRLGLCVWSGVCCVSV